MRKALVIAGLLGFAVLAMAARPGSEWQLVQQLNGQPTRWRMPDAGLSGMFAASANVACMPLTGGTTGGGGRPTKTVMPNVLVIVPLTPGNLCVRPSAASPFWDGGCHAYYPGDENQGVPLAPGVPQYITPDPLVTNPASNQAAAGLCFSGDAGSVVVPVWTVQ